MYQNFTKLFKLKNEDLMLRNTKVIEIFDIYFFSSIDLKNKPSPRK